MSEAFGCKACWPESADAAWEARATLREPRHLIDESHFHVMILKCPACSQAFVSVFTETIDWADGEDPQYWITLPLTPEEVASLSRVSEESLNALGQGRRSLAHDYPKGKAAVSYWRTGVTVGFHD